MSWHLIVIGLRKANYVGQATVATCVFVMERYFQRRQAFVEPGPGATAVAHSMESEGADDHDIAMAQSKETEEAGDRDGCARAVVRAPEIGCSQGCL